MLKNMKQRTYGFTLIELLVVIAIIGILATVIMASLSEAREKGRDAKRARDAQELQKAIELYYDQNGMYPNTPTGALVVNMNTGTADITPFISQVPRDPTNSGNYVYAYRIGNQGSAGQDAERQSYTIRMMLEADGIFCKLSGVAKNYPGVAPGYSTYEAYPACNF